MPLLYSVISRGATILTKHAICPGNFAEVTEQILEKISPQEDDKLTYSHGQYLFHYVTENGIIFMCITDEGFERSKAFSFLNAIKRRFMSTYGGRVHTALPYAMNSDFSIVLAGEMKLFSNERETGVRRGEEGGGRGSYGSVESSGVSRVQREVEDLKQIMVRNIDTLAERGEKLELLVDRSQHLEAGTVSFRTRSRNLSHAMCMKNVKIAICIVGIAAVLLFIIVTASCGGFTYSKCGGKK